MEGKNRVAYIIKGFKGSVLGAIQHIQGSVLNVKLHSKMLGHLLLFQCPVTAI